MPAGVPRNLPMLRIRRSGEGYDRSQPARVGEGMDELDLFQKLQGEGVGAVEVAHRQASPKPIKSHG